MKSIAPVNHDLEDDRTDICDAPWSSRTVSSEWCTLLPFQNGWFSRPCLVQADAAIWRIDKMGDLLYVNTCRNETTLEVKEVVWTQSIQTKSVSHPYLEGTRNDITGSLFCTEEKTERTHVSLMLLLEGNSSTLPMPHRVGALLPILKNPRVFLVFPLIDL